MFNKSFLVNKIVNSLLKKEFQVLLTQGCFDIAAKRENLLLLKVLINVDGLEENQALSLRAISYFLSAYPFIISLKTNREFLDKRTIYSRFELPVVTPELFEEILIEEAFAVQSSKGKHTVVINAELLRNKRKELEFTLEELSDIIGISKKALYEIENKRVNPTVETVKKLESFLKVDLQLPYEMKSAKETYLKPKEEFQERVSKEFFRMGINNSAVYSAPFEIVGKEKFSLIASLSKNTIKIKREAEIVKKLSSIFSSLALFVAKKSREKNIEGVPIILESELPEIENSKELNRMIEEKFVR
jgi:putative transcriptional regulator